MRRALLLLVTLFLAGSAFAQTPAIDHISPTYAIVSSSDLTLTVTGSGFAGGNTVLWNGAGLTTTFVSSSQLTAVIPAANMAAIGAAFITVSGTGSSNGVSFRVISPVAQVLSWYPTVFTPGTATQLTVYGSGFTPQAVVYFDWQVVSTTFISPTQVNASVGSGLITAGQHSIHVINGAPAAPTKILSLSTLSLAFGSTTIGSTSSSTITLTNTGSATVTFAGFSLAGLNPSEFAISANTCVATLTASSTCVASLTSTPATLGPRIALFSVASDAVGSPQSSNLSVTGTAPTGVLATVSPTPLVFGNVVQSVTSTSLSSYITNAGSTNYTISAISVTGTNSADFNDSASTCTAMTLTPGQNCIVTATFTPSTTGAESAAVSITDNDANHAIPLSGAGIASGGHYMALSWTASVSSSVIGYNVYRGPSSGGPWTLLTPSPISATTYTDNAVTSGSTYFYVITTVGSNPPYTPVESLNSTQASGTIP